ncbi:MAG: hypothetical protein IPP37_10775 [Saprospiraceae bacterium]|nr:hypothetical protein [Saprospiraceae bacterium]
MVHILIFILVWESHSLMAQKQLELGNVKWLRNLDEGKSGLGPAQAHLPALPGGAWLCYLSQLW